MKSLLSVWLQFYLHIPIIGQVQCAPPQSPGITLSQPGSQSHLGDSTSPSFFVILIILLIDIGRDPPRVGFGPWGQNKPV